VSVPIFYNHYQSRIIVAKLMTQFADFVFRTGECTHSAGEARVVVRWATICSDAASLPLCGPGPVRGSVRPGPRARDAL
jgi:hypothetical protein